MTSRPLIQLRGVKKAFGEVRVLEGVDLDVNEGETFVLLGGSGSGKTVLMKHLDKTAHVSTLEMLWKIHVQIYSRV